jgi:signal peptidase II
LWQNHFGRAILVGMSDNHLDPISQEVDVPAETGPEGFAQEPSEKPNWALLVFIAGVVLLIDQGIKALIMSRLVPGQSYDLIPTFSSFFRITYSYNTGAAFGMLPQASDVFLILALVTVVAFVVSYPKLPSHALLSRISIGLISGGALSNAVDRIRFQHVIDYVHIRLTPTFSNISNIADHAITLGVIILLIDQWMAEQREKKALESVQTESDPQEPVSFPADVDNPSPQ